MPSRERDERDERIEAEVGDRLRDRYEDLKQLRQTQPEREAAAARKALENHMGATEKLVGSLRAQLEVAQQGKVAQPPDAAAEADAAALRAENAELMRKLEQAEARAAAAAAAPSTGGDGANAPAVAALEAKVAFFEMMTGMSVDLAGDVAKCVVRCDAPSDDDAPSASAAAVRRAAFELHLAPAEGDEGDIEYVPTDLTSLPTDQLPEYLTDSIMFEREQAPGFLRRLLAGVVSEDN